MSFCATGEGIRMATAIGADLTGMSDMQLHPCGTSGTGLMENIRTSGCYRIFVNIHGDRFANEGAAREVLAQAILDQDDQTYWIVVSSVRYPCRDFVESNGRNHRRHGRPGRCHRSEHAGRARRKDRHGYG